MIIRNFTKFLHTLLFVVIFIALFFLIALFAIPNLGYMFLDKIDSFIMLVDKNDVIADVTYKEIANNIDSDLVADKNDNYKIDKVFVSIDSKKGFKSNHLKLYPNFNFQQINGILEIPAIDVKGKIVSGKEQKLMLLGFWHVNINGAWLGAGNIVIFGHRFYHLPPAKDTFFNLDKVKIGDVVIIKTNIGTWTYKVYNISVVSKYNTDIFKNTSSPEISLVTCHPLWTSKRRLVVHAKLQTSIVFE